MMLLLTQTLVLLRVTWARHEDQGLNSVLFHRGGTLTRGGFKWAGEWDAGVAAAGVE